jgi:hypothetical protein
MSIHPLSLALASALLAGRAVAGPVFHVNSPADVVDWNPGDGKCETAPSNGVCTLRAAVMEANHTTGATIQIPEIEIGLSIPGTFQDDSKGDLNLTSSMSIVGAGPGKSVVSASGIDGVFGIPYGAAVTVSISGLTIRDGNPHGIRLDAGALSVDQCAFENDTVTLGDGGGIAAFGGSLTVTNTTFTNCHAYSARGGAIYSSVPLHVSGSVFAGNSADAGGALMCEGTASIVNSTISGNSAHNDGGGIQTFAFADVDVVNTTISSNQAGNLGGGIKVSAGPLRLRNVTITQNQADADFDGTGSGGGISVDGGSVSFVNSIVAGNFETLFLVSVHVQVDGDCSGTLTSAGYNVMKLKPGGCTVTGPITMADPKLGPLQDNGGFGMTHALLSGSPALDGGNPSGCTDALGAPLTIDQRGSKRPQGARCDIGAYERGPGGDANGDGLVDVADVFFLINYLFAGGPLPVGLANVNQDVVIDVNDVFYLINYLFAGGPAPK